MASQKRVTAVIAGTQSGKTASGPWWMYREIYGGENPVTGEYIPPAWQRETTPEGLPRDFLIVTSTYDLFKLKLLPEVRNVFEGITHTGRWHAGDKVLELCDPETNEFYSDRGKGEMWGRIILRSANAPGGLESASALAAWLDEAGQDEFTLDAWDAIMRRLSLARGRILITTTPYNLGWLKQKLFDPWAKGERTDIEVIQFASITNPAFPVEEFESRRNEMQEWKFLMFYYGIFTRPAGMIYKDLISLYREDGGHKVKRFDIPESWPRYVGVDPGAVNLATVWFAKDPDTNIYYIYRATKEPVKSTPEHVAQMKIYQREDRAVPEGYWVGAKPETQQRLDWEDAGIEDVFEPPYHDVEAGIDKVTSLIRPFKLFIMDDLDDWWDEAGRYSRELDEMNEPTEEIKDKKRFHLMDATRYGAAGAEDGPSELVVEEAPRILDPVYRDKLYTDEQHPKRRRLA